MWTRISCPATACNQLLEYNDVQELAEPRTFARRARIACPIINILINGID